MKKSQVLVFYRVFNLNTDGTFLGQAKRRVISGLNVYFRILNNDASGELTYLLADLDAREAVLIDPHGADLPVWRASLAEQELRLCSVLRTHHHDALPPDEAERLALLGAAVVQGDALATLQVADGDALPFGGELVRILATPGHPPLPEFWLARPLFLRRFAGGHRLPAPAAAGRARGALGQRDSTHLHPAR